MTARSLRAFAFAGALGATFVIPVERAAADPFVPKAGHGSAKLLYKNITSHTSFTTSFGTATQSSKTGVDERRIEVTGERGLGNGWALQYDLRAARVTTSKRSTALTGDGFQEEQLTLLRQVYATPRLAEGVGLDFVLVPGSDAAAGAHYALQPEYQIGTRGPSGAYSSFTVGPRFYAGGHGTQLRAEFAAGRGLSRSLAGSMTLLYSASLGPKVSTTLVEYNVLRAGVFLRAARGRLRPEIGYERNLAGQGMHASQLVDVGFSMAY